MCSGNTATQTVDEVIVTFLARNVASNGDHVSLTGEVLVNALDRTRGESPPRP